MSFGEKLAYLRKKNDLKQHELAEKINVTRGAIGMYETDKREAQHDILLKISKLFNVSVDYLIDNETPIYFNDSINFYEKELGPLKNLTEDDIKALRFLINHFNKKNSK